MNILYDQTSAQLNLKFAIKLYLQAGTPEYKHLMQIGTSGVLTQSDEED